MLTSIFLRFFGDFWKPEPFQNLENQCKTIGFPMFFSIFINCLRCTEILQECFQHGRWKPPRPPKTLPRDSQDAPRWPQNVTRMPQVPPKMLQVPPKMPPRPLQDAQNASKSAQEAPKLPQEPLNTAPSRFAARFLEVSGPPILTKIIEHGFANSNLFDVNTLVQV